MTPHCCNCRYWSEPTSFYDRLRPCHRIEAKNSVEPTLDDVDIETDYGAATLLTGPHFGCAHFEVKP